MSEGSTLCINDKEIATPGEIIAQGMDYLPSFGTYRSKNDILANRLGLVRVDGKVIKIIPLSGRYLPKMGDVIIAKVTDISMSGWRLDTNSAYSAMISLKDGSNDFIRKGADLTKYYDIGEYVLTKITKVTSQRLVDMTLRGPGLKKLEGGRVISVIPSKVPRIIGKHGSMVVMIKEITNCNVVVGQNGLVWIKGEPEDEILAVRTVKKIEAESHKSGLTDTIQKYLEKNKR